MKLGNKAPLFTLKDQDDNKVSLKDYLGKKTLVLYFYPKAMTPGCTVQAQGIRDIESKLKKNKVVVFGISPDTPDKLKKFQEKYDLNFSLLSDPDHKVAEKYGVWGDKKFMGKSYKGILRTTFILTKEGKIFKIMDKVKTKSHHDDLFDYLP